MTCFGNLEHRSAAFSWLRGDIVIWRPRASWALHKPVTTATVMVPVPTNPILIFCGGSQGCQKKLFRFLTIAVTIEWLVTGSGAALFCPCLHEEQKTRSNVIITWLGSEATAGFFKSNWGTSTHSPCTRMWAAILREYLWFSCIDWACWGINRRTYLLCCKFSVKGISKYF